MNSTLLLQSSAWLLVATAAVGLFMAFIRFGRRGLNPPAWLAMAHGFLAAASVTLLTFAALTVGVPGLALGGLALLLVAAAWGVAMNLGYHLKGAPLPKWLVGVHAAAAIAGSALVLLAAIGTR